ncbi:MAG: cation:proton antiporter [Deltaproteobacteria bacterium]|nr:cation:proton antiporter [Deltaproteobacteria bacterium]
MENNLLLICVMLTGAAAIPFISRRLRIPAPACEIAFGMLLFNTVIGSQPDWFTLLRDLGLIYLMFIAGLELDIGRMLNNLRASLWMLALSLLPFLVMPPAVHLLGLPWYLGVALSVVSVGIMLPVLRESDLIKTPAGTVMIDAAHIGELLSIAVLTALVVYHDYGFSVMSLVAALKLVVLMAAAVMFLLFMHAVSRRRPDWVSRVLESNDPFEEGIRAVIAVAFVGALLAQYAGVKAVLGPFMAGAVLNSVFRNRGIFEQKIHAVGFGFFTPFFFIGIGAAFELRMLTSPGALVTALGLTGLLFAGRLTFVLFRSRLGLDARQGFGTALLMAAPLSMLVVTGTLGERMGMLSPEMNSTLVLTALVSSLLYPALFRVFVRER